MAGGCNYARSESRRLRVRCRDLGGVQERPEARQTLVPAQMHEEFFAGANRRGWADATWISNYRRFQTSARIVPQDQY